MSTDTNTKAKKRPDFIAYAAREDSKVTGPKYTRIGVGFNLKNGGISVLHDAIPLSGQIVLVDTATDEKPTTILHTPHAGKPSFEANMVRDGSGDNSYWTEIGSAWRKDGYVLIQLEVVPTSGKVILTLPREDRQ